MPIVVMKEGVNESSLKRSRQHDLPTPESPISRSLICVLTTSVHAFVGSAPGSIQASLHKQKEKAFLPMEKKKGGRLVTGASAR